MKKAQEHHRTRLPVRYYAGMFGVCLLGASVAGLIWSFLRENDGRAATADSFAAAQATAHEIEDGLEARNRALERQAASWSILDGAQEDEQERAFAKLIKNDPSLIGVGWVTAGGRVRRAIPHEGKHPILGRDLTKDPLRAPALREAQVTKIPVVSRPLKTLLHDENGFLSIFPLFRQGRPDGFLVAVFELRSLVPALSHAAEHRLAVYDDTGSLLYRQDTAGDWREHWQARAPLKVQGNTWWLEATPSAARAAALRTRTPFVGLMLALLFAAFVAALYREISARRRAEEELRHQLDEHLASERKFRLLFDSNTDAQFLIDDSGIIDCNPSTVKILGANSKEEIIGSHPARFSPEVQPDGRPSVPQTDLIEAGIRKDGVFRFEWTHRRIDGTPFRAEVSVIAVEYEGRLVQLVSWHDLTEQKNIQAKLVESSKMSSLGEMASGMAHELNTPLAVIKGKAEFLSATAAQRPLTPEELVRHLGSIDKMVDRMSVIIRSLRFFARESGGESMQAVRVALVLEETLALCQSRFTNHGIELRVSGDLDTEIRCRPVQISQILLNLLGNAFDAVASQPEKLISVTVSAKPLGTEIAVEDSGPGIPPSLRSKIMQPFFTTKEVGKGTGLGLSISAGLASSNGARLFLDPACPRTRFVLELPLALSGENAGQAA